MTSGDRPAEASILDFSLVREDGLHNAQRLTHLMPLRGFGAPRRIAILIAITWLPLAIAALINRHAFEGTEPLLRHFGVHVRFLVAIPLFILAEPLAERVGRRVISYFLTSDLVAEPQRPSFVEIVQSCRRLLRSRLALLAVVAFAAVQSASAFHDLAHMHEIHGWASSSDGDGLGWGAWWFLLVSRPIFVQSIPTFFAPVIAGSSAVLASRWGHDVLYHQVPVESLRLPMALFVALALVLFLAPLLVFAPTLMVLKRKSLLAYGALVGRHGRLVERRWVRGETIADEGLLEAPELGPVADTLTLYDAIGKLRLAPIGKQSIVTVAGAAFIPMLPVIAIQVPIKEQLLGVLKILL
jgi:hypothetical protein